MEKVNTNPSALVCRLPDHRHESGGDSHARRLQRLLKCDARQVLVVSVRSRNGPTNCTSRAGLLGLLGSGIRPKRSVTEDFPTSAAFPSPRAVGSAPSWSARCFHRRRQPVAVHSPDRLWPRGSPQNTNFCFAVIWRYQQILDKHQIRQRRNGRSTNVSTQRFGSHRAPLLNGTVGSNLLRFLTMDVSNGQRPLSQCVDEPEMRPAVVNSQG
jgi:hypothetical protein